MVEETTKPTKKPAGPDWLDDNAVIDGDKWLVGFGSLPSDYMMILERPTPEDARADKILCNPAGTKLQRICNEIGLNFSDVYVTNAVKYITPGNRAVNAGDVKKCAPFLKTEIEKCKPKVIICMGANALKSVMGRKAKLGDVRGTFIDHPELPGVQVFATYSPGYIMRNPDAEPDYSRELSKLVDHQNGIAEVFGTTESIVIQTLEQLQAFRDFIIGKAEAVGSALICVDCEWNGATWMSPDRYIRMVQIGWQIGSGAVIEFWDEGVPHFYDEDDKKNKIKRGDPIPWCPEFKRPVMDNHPAAWAIIREILTHPRIMLMGQNIISDGQWLKSYDIDIRENVVYDTMLAEHTINEAGPFALTELTCKYTNLGRYDMALHAWVNEHKAECIHGYGPVPRELLVQYSASDVDAPLRIALCQAEALKEFQEPRGDYPSLWDSVMYTQKMLYEVEGEGMAVDLDRLTELCSAYEIRLNELANRLTTMAAAPEVGYPNFNFRSTPQVSKLLFNDKHLGLRPVKTTKGRPWKDIILQPNQQQDIVAVPSTDKNTLDILQDHHPIAKLLGQVRKLDTVYKVFLKTDPEADESTTGGGIGSKVWQDGRLHPRFSQLADTGRFRTSKPNCQNWPKRAEGDMAEIFGGMDKVPQLIRTIIVPKPGHYLIEADYCQAELFVLASLSRDANMHDALSTPGKDLHDMTAISAFQLQVLQADGKPQDESQLLEMAVKDHAGFEAYQKTLIYLDQRGKRLTREAFKKGIRVSAKNLNFGIPWISCGIKTL